MRKTKILKKLQADAIEFAEYLRLQRNAVNAFDFEKGMKDVQDFFNRIKNWGKSLGRYRMVRILRHRTPAIRGVDKNATGAYLEEYISWVEAVQMNIEYELETDDRKWILILTVASVITATAAAIASVISVVK